MARFDRWTWRARDLWRGEWRTTVIYRTPARDLQRLDPDYSQFWWSSGADGGAPRARGVQHHRAIAAGVTFDPDAVGDRHAVLAWCADHPRADGVQVDRAAAAEIVRRRVDERRLEPPLPQCAGALVSCVEVPNVEAPRTLHHLRCTRRGLWRRYKVFVIGHRRVGVDRAPG